jgi:two-component system sensor kinase FixL
MKSRAARILIVDDHPVVDDQDSGWAVGILRGRRQSIVAKVNGLLSRARNMTHRTDPQAPGEIPAEAAIRDSERRLRLMADALPVLISYVDAGQRYQFNNAPCEEWFGIPADFCRGRHLRDVLGEEAYQAIRPHVESALAGNRVSFEEEVSYRGVRTRIIHADYIPHRGEGGEVLGFHALVQDVTEARRAAEAVRRERDFSDRLIDTVQAIILVLDGAGRIVRFNKFMEELTGHRLDEVRGKDWFDTFLPPGDRPRIRELFTAAWSGVRTCGNVNPILTRDGREREIEWYDITLTDEGRLVGLLSVGHDVTDRKRAEEALRENESWLRAIVTTAADGIITINEQGCIESVNPAAEQMFGYTTEEMVGQDVSMLMPSPFREEHPGYLARYLQTGEKRIMGIEREVRGRRKDGSTFPLDLAVSEVVGGNSFTGILRDISSRKALEREVLEVSALEQRRIGQDLHDTVGQELTGLALMAETLAEALGERSPLDAADAARIAEGLRQALGQVRALSRGLVPVEVDAHGLMAALADLARRTSGQGGVVCTFRCDEPVSVEDTATATHLFRIAQGALANALKHSAARHVEVRLDSDGPILTLSVRDDGVGLLAGPVETQGLGIRIMRYRAGLIGATLDVGPAPGGGTLVTCSLTRGNSHEVQGRQDPDRR